MIRESLFHAETNCLHAFSLSVAHSILNSVTHGLHVCYEDVSGQRSKAAAGSRTWLKNIKNWRKKFTKTELNFADDGFSKSCSASKESLDKIR